MSSAFGWRHWGRCSQRGADRRGELQSFERLLPTIRIAEAFVEHRARSDETPQFAMWADATQLSMKERDVAALVVRGPGVSSSCA